MLRITAFLLLLTAASVSASGVALRPAGNPPSIRDRFRDIVGDATVPEDEITSNPVQIYNNPLMTMICSNNVPGDYQNPFTCNQFIMCGSYEAAYLAECDSGCIYAPLPDECVFTPVPPQETCPWPNTWSDPDICKNLAKRPFWSVLTLPTYPEQRCGEDIYFCGNNTQLYDTTQQYKCPPGFGYSKGYLACLELETCNEVDTYLGM